ncbi:Holliday junction resolvase MOC1, chloroplastic [Cyclospora cayetanensis]|uniref:Holliday junction resolvase MOC1, chloroplastic n=1 Tax=Cyclospora cayetanensis TaxID=88456 RepID=A0A6P6RTR5_9EIME|nr:Holliday junction resolvase MOC1, chloroplastic [Cyclospora cayetanensis]
MRGGSLRVAVQEREAAASAAAAASASANTEGPLLQWFPGFDLPIGLKGRAILRRVLNQRRSLDTARCKQILSEHGIVLGRGVPGHTTNWGGLTVKELLHAAHLLGCWRQVEELCLSFCCSNGLKIEWVRELRARGPHQVTLANLLQMKRNAAAEARRKRQQQPSAPAAAAAASAEGAAALAASPAEAVGGSGALSEDNTSSVTGAAAHKGSGGGSAAGTALATADACFSTSVSTLSSPPPDARSAFGASPPGPSQSQRPPSQLQLEQQRLLPPKTGPEQTDLLDCAFRAADSCGALSYDAALEPLQPPSPPPSCSPAEARSRAASNKRGSTGRRQQQQLHRQQPQRLHPPLSSHAPLPELQWCIGHSPADPSSKHLTTTGRTPRAATAAEAVAAAAAQQLQLEDCCLGLPYAYHQEGSSSSEHQAGGTPDSTCDVSASSWGGGVYWPPPCGRSPNGSSTSAFLGRHAGATSPAPSARRAAAARHAPAGFRKRLRSRSGAVSAAAAAEQQEQQALPLEIPSLQQLLASSSSDSCSCCSASSGEEETPQYPSHAVPSEGAVLNFAGGLPYDGWWSGMVTPLLLSPGNTPLRNIAWGHPDAAETLCGQEADAAAAAAAAGVAVSSADAASDVRTACCYAPEVSNIQGSAASCLQQQNQLLQQQQLLPQRQLLQPRQKRRLKGSAAHQQLHCQKRIRHDSGKSRRINSQLQQQPLLLQHGMPQLFAAGIPQHEHEAFPATAAAACSPEAYEAAAAARMLYHATPWHLDTQGTAAAAAQAAAACEASGDTRDAAGVDLPKPPQGAPR